MALTLQLTNAGLDAIVDATGGGTDDVFITQIGLTAEAFTQAPTLTAIPGEFKRLDTVAGQEVAPNVIHMTGYDTSADVYDVRGFGLYLSDGTLFATHSADDPVLSKAQLAFGLFSLDVAFSDDVAAAFSFGDNVFLYPPATETVRGVAKLATQARVDAAADGEDDAETIVTPKTLRARLATFWTAVAAAIGVETAARNTAITAANTARLNGDNALAADIAAETAARNTAIAAEATARGTAIAAETAARNTAVAAANTARTNGDNALAGDITALAAKTVTGAGLASGGGAISGNPQITVAEASAAEIAAGTATDKVVTPRRLGPIAMSLTQNGFIRFFGFQIVWGRFLAAGNGSTAVAFAEPFVTACFSVVVSGVNVGGADSQDNPPGVAASTISVNGFSVFSAEDPSITTCFIAVGT